MMDNQQVAQSLREAQFLSFPQIAQRFQQISTQTGMNVGSLISTFGNLGGFNYTGPYIQNNRVKRIGTSPITHTKDEVADMLQHPLEKERELRQTARELDWASYTFRHMRRVYTNLLTYHSYIAPDMVDPGAMNDAFWREYRLAEKLRKVLHPEALAREAAGKCVLEGKVFYTYRMSADKPRNRINYAFYQQLPSDWVKIVGFNNVSKYTLAFDMMYFTQPGTDVNQFPPELFANYWSDFTSLVTVEPQKQRKDGRVVYAQRGAVNLSAVRSVQPDAEVYNENGRWFYWVTLPVDKAFTIEADDAITEVAPPLAGLFIALLQFADLEKIQLALYQNPLLGFVHGEMPYFDTKDTNTADQVKMSDAMRRLFQQIWYDLMAANSTGGIPIYFAPVENMKLETFNEVENTSEIVSQGNKDIVTQAGLSAVSPASDEARAGAVQVSLQIEGKYLNPVYQGVERLMRCAIADLNLRHEFEYHMFGDLYADAQLEERLSKEMTLGILPATILYNALHDRSILDDICWSHMVEKSGVLDARIPLISSYSAKQENGLPPQVKHDLDPGGRPESDGITSDGQEADADADL